eukprot:7309662-Prymnesium_polylepis.1
MVRLAASLLDAQHERLHSAERHILIPSRPLSGGDDQRQLGHCAGERTIHQAAHDGPGADLGERLHAQCAPHNLAMGAGFVASPIWWHTRTSERLTVGGTFAHSAVVCGVLG